MKTVQELIRDADSLNKFIAATHETQNHLLTTIDDEFAQDVYLTLLMSVAETAGQFDETKDNPLAYVCKIAAELPVAPDMQEIFRRSLLINEKILNDYSVTLKQHNLQNLLLFDALTMQILYAKDNVQMSEYIAGLANVFGTGTDGLGEILSIAKTVINHQADFDYKFQHINLQKEFLPLLRSHTKNLSVESPDVFIKEFAEQTDMTEKLPLSIAGKSLTSFRNIYIHDAKKIFHMSDCENIIFEHCRFYNIKYFSKETMFRFVNITSIEFKHCQFESIIGKRNDNLIGENIVPRVITEGIIANLQNSDIYFDDVFFKNCYYMDYIDRINGRMGYACFSISCASGALISGNTRYVYHKQNCKFEESGGFFVVDPCDSRTYRNYVFHKDKSRKSGGFFILDPCDDDNQREMRKCFA